MSAQHTPVKLVAKVGFSTPPTPDEVEGTYYRIRAGKKLVALVPHVWQGGRTPLTLAHMTAIRLAACWNACTGIPTEKLEGMLNSFAQYISDIGGIAAGQAEQIECLKDQRAELLMALELAAGINPFGSVENAKARDAAIEAIASIKSATKEIQS